MSASFLVLLLLCTLCIPTSYHIGKHLMICRKDCAVEYEQMLCHKGRVFPDYLNCMTKRLFCPFPHSWRMNYCSATHKWKHWATLKRSSFGTVRRVLQVLIIYARFYRKCLPNGCNYIWVRQVNKECCLKFWSTDLRCSIYATCMYASNVLPLTHLTSLLEIIVISANKHCS